ncbi:MAG: GspE/PulE family protein [Desulfosudaceae bacterium]
MKTDQDTFQKNVREESATVSLRIGDCLLKEGFVTEDEIARALDIQQKEEKQLKFSKECVIPDLTGLSKKDMRLLLQQPPLDTNLGLICLQRGLLDKKTLYDVLKNKPDGLLLGETLIKEGYLTAANLEDILLEYLGMDKFCEVAEEIGLLTPDESRKARFTRKSPKTLGQILCDMGVINPADLDYVLKKYGKQIKFGEILVKEGIIDNVKLMSALQDQFHKEEPLGKILLEKKLITLDQLYQALSVQHNIPYQKITQLDLTEAQRQVLTNIVSRKYAQKNMVLPISLNGNKITVAVSDPEHLAAANDIKNVYSHLTVSPLFISQDNFIRLFEEIYQSGMNDILRVEAGKDKSPININALDINLSATGIDDTESRDKADYYGVATLEGQELVNYIIKYGIANGASDIHVEQDRKHPKVRYRIDGILHTLQMRWLDEKLADLINAVISRIKVISGLDIAERRLPQDGVFRVNYFDPRKKENVDLDFRVATCPGIVGENVTIRILDPRKAKVDIDKLGHSPDVVVPFKGFLKSAGGMILVSGPTGSGKTSTLYSALQYIYDPTIKIITAEDPIEYSFPGIMQTQINPKINLNFARLLRSFLRLDPDAILVGEIRDQETARISFDASQTGHLMLSTVHTNDSVSAITRLVDLGIDYNQIASSLMCVVAQRLLRKNCNACAVPYTPTEEEWAPLFNSPPDHLHFFHGEGCAQCGYSGYQGRTLISELFIITPEIARALNRETSTREIKKIAVNKGMKTMIEDGLSKIHDTTLSELIRVVPNEMLKEFRAKDKATTSLKGVSA